MNEELKIIISAEVDRAVKEMNKVQNELGDVAKQGEKTSKSFGSSMKSIGGAIAGAAKVVGGAVGALVAAVKSTEQYRESQAKLNSAFQAMGGSAAQAKDTYKDLYRFLGDSDKATEAASHLAKLTTNEQELAQWTKALQGVYATFGDSLPIEGLTEAANETAKVGKVTGALADALNWAGVSEDAFNASLASMNSEAEREAYIRQTLSGLYNDAANLYEKNNGAILAQREAQARLKETLAQVGQAAQPLLTSLTDLANALLSAVAPALEAVIPYITAFIDAISKAVSWVMTFINALLGKKSKTTETVEEISNGFGGAASSVGGITSGLEEATGAAEKLKRATQGFDELNVMQDNSSSGGGSGSGSGSGGGGGGGISGANVGTGLTDALEETASGAEGFGGKISEVFNGLLDKVGEWAELFTPAIDAWQEAFDNIDLSGAKESVANGLDSLKESFTDLSTYVLEEFTPNVTNSFSENIAPIVSDVLNFGISEAGKTFETYATTVENATNDIVIPALESIEMVATDSFEGVNKAWTKHGGSFLTELGKAFDGMRSGWDKFYSNVIVPIFNSAKEIWDKVWVEHLKPLWDELCDALLDIGTNIGILWNTYIKPYLSLLTDWLYPKIVNVVRTIGDVVSAITSGFIDRIKGIITTIKGLIQFITGVFTGDWKKAWEGVKNIFKGIWESLVAIFKTPINTAIALINGMIRGIVDAINGVIRIINKISFTIPDWVPGLGGKGFNPNIKEMSIPNGIPQLAQGGITMGDTLARIGEGGFKEAVLPLERNTEWMDILADRLANRGGTPSKIVLMLDSKELGWANINSINSITRQTGELQLQLV